ncbi:MAG TPA: ISL3 family transposase [Nitrospira sp.]|nr:ISL3 family transposase [Nitrospira sp.]
MSPQDKKAKRFDLDRLQSFTHNHTRYTHLLDLDGIKVWSVSWGERWKFRAVTEAPPANCPGCQNSMSLLKYGQKEISFDDLPLRGSPVRVKLSRQRYKCDQCKLLFIEPVEVLSPEWRATWRLVMAIAHASLHRPFLQLAKEYGMHERTIRRIAHSFFRVLDSMAQLPTPQWLGIDEVKVHGIPRVVFTNLKKRLTYHMLPDTQEKTIRAFLRSMPGREAVEVVCMDMCDRYRKIVRELLPDARIVVDKFHLVQLGMKAVDQVRREVKRKRRVKVKYDTRIVRKRRRNLTPHDREALSYWRVAVPQLADVFELREAFCDIWDAPNKTQARALYRAWKKKSLQVLPQAFRPRINQIQKWDTEVFNGLCVKVTNGYAERVNGIVNHLNRTTRRLGFDALRAKLLYVYGYPKSPLSQKPKAEWSDPTYELDEYERYLAEQSVLFESPSVGFSMHDIAEAYLARVELDADLHGQPVRYPTSPDDIEMMIAVGMMRILPESSEDAGLAA